MVKTDEMESVDTWRTRFHDAKELLAMFVREAYKDHTL